jgi:ligand-binding sensor domain-containing protein
MQLKNFALFLPSCRSEGGLWIGAYYDGVHYLRPGFDYFRHYDIPESEGRVVSYVEPTADGKGVWLGMTKDGGLCRFNMQKKEFISYSAKMEYTNVRAICEIGKELWVGFYSDGLLRYNLATGAKRYYRPVEKDTTTLSHSAVYKIFRTSTGVIYVGTLLGLDQYVPEKDCFMRIPEVRDTRIHDILEDHLGLIWVATYEEGLFQYNPTSQAWTHFIQSSKTGSLPANKLICLYADRQNKLYIGTEGEGLFQYNYETQISSL